MRRNSSTSQSEVVPSGWARASLPGILGHSAWEASPNPVAAGTQRLWRHSLVTTRGTMDYGLAAPGFGDAGVREEMGPPGPAVIAQVVCGRSNCYTEE